MMSLFFPSSLLLMESLLFLSVVFCPWTIASGYVLKEFINPNFTASNFNFVDSTGTFLISRNETFKAAMFNPGSGKQFYLCVIHVGSNTIIWSGNRDAPVNTSGIMSLTSNGINITEDDGSFRWSTPPLQSSVSLLQLTEAGNLVLLDHFNNSIWESFLNPTDTIVVGQRLLLGMFLSSPASDSDLSTGDYRLALTASDAALQWQNQTYWKLSMEVNAYQYSSFSVEFMAVNQTGLYLVGNNGSAIVIQVSLSPAGLRIAKLDSSGKFIISSISGSNIKQDFMWPLGACQIPNICGRLGLCTPGAPPNTPVCSCPSSFNHNPQNKGECLPSDGSYSLPVSCNATNSSSLFNPLPPSYVRLGNGLDYFANDFSAPVKVGVDLLACQDFCSTQCSCLAFFYDNSSGSCYAIQNQVGSIILRTSRRDDRSGFIKVLIGASTFDGKSNVNNQSLGFPLIGLILLPFTGLSVLIALGFLLWRRSRVHGVLPGKASQPTSPPSGDLEAFSIPGLPVRFDYEELEAATENFSVQIGAGGFGAVYKGTLPDKTHVAVKKITSLGIQGKKDFCTEIAVIGNIHHVNLVKLKGYCAQGRQRLLVYEYMNRGSLDRTLFGTGPALEWHERIEIALGAARGLAYLHSGCDQKIIHCDVKPENILLHDNFQAKISDFGLSKLLNREESGLITTMRGTRGYLAPEWLTSAAISDKTDVYSFGMVLLEIVSGRKNCSFPTRSHSLDDDSSSGEHSSSSSTQGLIYFPLLALEMHEQRRYIELADQRLQGRVSSEEVEKLVRVALCCVHEEPALRPNMASVVGMLEGEIPLTEPRVESLNFLRFYGRRFAEASTLGEGGQQTNAIRYSQANPRMSSVERGAQTFFSNISSQQVSGPR